MNKEWQFYGTASHRFSSNTYYIWTYRDLDNRQVFQATLENEPPSNDAGFFKLDALLSLKASGMIGKQYILHFKGIAKGAIGLIIGYRFEGYFKDFEEFTEYLYRYYEHIIPREFYIDGEKKDYLTQFAREYVAKKQLQETEV